MANELGYYRHPTVFGERVVFVSEDDLWTVHIDGGTARRLTANPGTPSFPAFSPDGKMIAFTGRDDGPGEVYVMSADGESPRRLTWMGARTQVVGWTKDGQSVLAATDWRQPFEGVMHLIAVPLTGGPPKILPYGPARAISFSPDSGGTVIGRNSGDPARWKRYRGGTAGTIWIDRHGRQEFRSLVTLNGNLANPMWVGSRIYFLSDHEGHGNIHSCTPTGRDLKRHTHHDDYYVRFPSTDGRRHIVYHGGADLFCFDIEADRTRKIDVRLRSTRSQLNRRFVKADRYFETFDLHPEGHSLASVHRGGLFTMGLWEGAPVRLGGVSSVRHRLGTWLKDGERIVTVTDESGEESLLVLSLDGESAPRAIPGDFGRPIELKVAPQTRQVEEKAKGEPKKKAGRKKPEATANLLALTNHRHELILVNIDTGETRVLDRSAHRRIQGVAWSPDSRWIAYGHSSSERTCAIRLYEVATGKIVTVAREDFFDVNPDFDPEGRYLYFISWRTYNPVYDSLYFDLGFPKGARPYLMTLQRDTVSPFDSATRKPRPPGSHNGDHADEESPAAGRIRIDLEGIEERVVAFPVSEGRYGRILGARGRALYSAHPVAGSLDDGTDREPSSEGVLEYWDLKESKSGRVSDKITDFCLSADRRVLGIRSGNRIRVLPAGHKDDPEKNSDECSRETGWIDLDRISIAVIPGLEWKQMYREAWRLQREHFWNPNMAGVDWKAVYERYLPLVERVSTRTEFSDFMWEMQGELGTSHCYEMGGDYLPRPDWRQGFLGADLEYDTRTRRWRVVRIPKGDSWSADGHSPLRIPGVGIQAGDELLSIGGDDVGETASPYEKLVNMANREVRLRIRRRGRRAGGPETVVVRTLQDETPLRYRDWVEQNRQRVHEETGGRVGYVHIPDMGPAGYAEFHRYYNPESVRDGLIVDVRFNRGGHVSQLLLEKLVRKRIGYDVSRWSEPVPYPDAAPMGPMVALTNEYAGSDGDVFCHAFKLFQLGPLIGKRTWGGVVGIWPRASLVDGTVTTQPEFASWFEDVEYGVENYGTDPDVEIDNLPQDYAVGRDRQLERAVSAIRDLLRKRRAKRPRVLR